MRILLLQWFEMVLQVNWPGGAKRLLQNYTVTIDHALFESPSFAYSHFGHESDAEHQAESR